ncbi:zf-HC2 domain-containing protein [Chengkuizengella axinellae]|uniref:Anti-sigma-W factor RsiW n=1 Tax=Chengkuizengella axinellae TaxID=3064388 RepID=A0ABT9J6C7_9BACL|nr:zf-HC2 domain-containing protein [Chengkuizengella sp. 2205SS18-9]MDP5277167.1 zf-HC2 domain-containing protein [Chengkuizengella sp. 2205SS18-9]
MNCKQVYPLLHEYLDGDLAGVKLHQVSHHLDTCSKCKENLVQLEKTEALTRSLPKSPVPEDLTDKIMDVIPMKKKSRWMSWAKRYPAMAAAAVFVIIMGGSLFALNEPESNLIVSGSGMEYVVIKDNQVIVPEGQTVHGDLIVENGEIVVKGTVNGDLTLIDGEINLLASAEKIAGEVTHIDQTLDWIWYKISVFFDLFTK